MFKNNILALAVLLLINSGALGRRFYAFRLPNALNVANPCSSNSSWVGIGHVNPRGGGRLNPFGRDFAANGLDWPRICPLDSDNDGKTNGEELGDPYCEWKSQSGTTFKPTTASHPGICEPINSDYCKSQNWWLQSHWCPNLDNSTPDEDNNDVSNENDYDDDDDDDVQQQPSVQSGCIGLHAPFVGLVSFLGMSWLKL